MAIDLSDSDLLKTSSYVGGEWMPDSSNRLAVTNPATGEVIAEAGAAFDLQSYHCEQMAALAKAAANLSSAEEAPGAASVADADSSSANIFECECSGSCALTATALPAAALPYVGQSGAGSELTAYHGAVTKSLRSLLYRPPIA